MSTLSVWFVSSASPELFRCSFSGALAPTPLNSIRGKELAPGTTGTFQWTRAVHALAIFLVEMRLLALQPQATLSLAGEDGSAALSLDYALSKQPQWLVDMFGWDNRGNALVRRLIKRGNPERKRPGPVTLSLNTALLPPQRINIYWNDHELQSAEEMKPLLQALLQSWPGNVAIKLREPIKAEPADNLTNSRRLPVADELRALIKQLIIEEIAEMLARTDVFNPHRLRTKLNELATNPSVVRYAGKRASSLGALDQDLPSSWRLGFPEYLNNGHPLREQRLRVAIPAMNPGPIALFTYLRLVHGINIKVKYLYPHSAEIVGRLAQGVLDEHVEAAVIGIAHTSVLLGQNLGERWRPFMLMPSLTHRVVAPKVGADQPNGRYLLLRDVPSNANFYFEDLVRRGSIEASKTTTEHAEPDEVPILLAEADPESRAVLFFPHHRLNTLFNNCSFVDTPNGSNNLMESILVVGESLQQNPAGLALLNVLLRDAWLELRTSLQARELVTEAMLSDETYLKFFQRSCGLHNFPTLTADGFGSQLGNHAETLRASSEVSS